MKSINITLIIISIFCVGCIENKMKPYIQVMINQVNITPTVDIKECTLITNNKDSDSIEAVEILKVKRNFPLAMQGKDSTLFENILAKAFTFRATYEFYNRADFIHNRINGTWTIDTVKYHNLVLQFFGDTAVLTYFNTLSGTDDKGNPNIEHYWWADMYVKENGQWKIEGVHEIDSRIEYIP